MIAVLLKPPHGSPKTRLNTADRIGIDFPSFPTLHQSRSNPLHLGNTPLHLAMESAHAEAAIMLIEAGADRSRVGSVSFQRRPYFLVPNRVIMFLNAGESGQRDTGASRRRWRARTETCQGVCYFTLRPPNVTLVRGLSPKMYKYRHTVFVFAPIDIKGMFIDCCLAKSD